jgi:hypothetical protein
MPITGIGDSLLVKAVCEATGRKKEAVEEAYEKVAVLLLHLRNQIGVETEDCLPYTATRKETSAPLR